MNGFVDCRGLRVVFLGSDLSEFGGWAALVGWSVLSCLTRCHCAIMQSLLVLLDVPIHAALECFLSRARLGGDRRRKIHSLRLLY